jgi:hypothetical protein
MMLRTRALQYLWVRAVVVAATIGSTVTTASAADRIDASFCRDSATVRSAQDKHARAFSFPLLPCV